MDKSELFQDAPTVISVAFGVVYLISLAIIVGQRNSLLVRLARIDLLVKRGRMEYEAGFHEKNGLKQRIRNLRVLLFTILVLIFLIHTWVDESLGDGNVRTPLIFLLVFSLLAFIAQLIRGAGPLDMSKQTPGDSSLR